MSGSMSSRHLEIERTTRATMANHTPGLNLTTPHSTTNLERGSVRCSRSERQARPASSPLVGEGLGRAVVVVTRGHSTKHRPLQPEILGICEGAKEDKAGWSAFLKHLKERGLKEVRL